ncbi:MAG: Na+/glucose cotransporter, partial [Bacteroidales bacterium]|nr:Na+/glucose cotransporter [Bacteroidales bacterium]
AVNFTLSVGTIISIGTGIFYLWIFPKEQYTFWPHFLLLSFFIFVFLAVLTFLISLSEKEAEARPHFDYGDLGRPDRKVLWLWAALIVVMIGLYVLFNGH